MKRQIITMTFRFSIAVAILAFADRAGALALFTDNFATGASPLWGNETGDWTVSGGNYFAQTDWFPDRHTYSSLPFTLTDFTFDVDVTNIMTSGIWLRTSGAPGHQNGVILIIGGDSTDPVNGRFGLYWHIMTDGTNGPIINRVTGLFESCVSDAHIHVVVQGDTYQAYVNGAPTPATTLKTSLFPSGRVALFDHNSSCDRFDNVVLVPAPALFTDNFDTGPSPLWGNETGDWTASGGRYFAQTVQLPDRLTYSSLPFYLTDFAFDVDIANVFSGGIWLRSTGAVGHENGVLLVMTPDAGGGGTAGLYWHTIFNGTNYVGGILNPAPALFPVGSNPHIRVIVQGNTYAAYVNGSLTPATTLTTSLFAGGKVGLYDHWLGSQEFDNVVVVATPRPSIRVSQVDICWDSFTNLNYQVQYRSALTTNEWINLGAPLAGNGTTTCVSDPVPLGQPSRFYQVVLVP